MRQFISETFPDRRGILEISGKDYRYLKQVLRVKPGDMLSVRFPDGELRNTTVAKIFEDRKMIAVQVAAGTETITRGVQAEDIQKEAPETEYYLFQFAAKPVKMEQIIRQAVECGVKYIIPVAGEFSQKSSVEALNGAKSDRIERIIREARQQSGSPVETAVTKCMTVEEALDFWRNEVCAVKQEETIPVILWERNENTKSLGNVFREKKKGAALKKAAVVVGCEGGISQDEMEKFCESGFIPVHFATNILRCETAALYGIAAVQSGILD